MHFQTDTVSEVSCFGRQTIFHFYLTYLDMVKILSQILNPRDKLMYLISHYCHRNQCGNMAQWVPKVHFTFTLLLINLADLHTSNNDRKEATVMNEDNKDI